MGLEPPRGGQSTLESEPSILGALNALLVSAAWAEKSKHADGLAEVRTWLPSQHNPDMYFDRIKKLLKNSAQKVLAKRKTSKGYAQMFPGVVLATAWQES